MNPLPNEEGVSTGFDADAAKLELKNKISEKVKQFDWLDQMRLKCKSYIKNNGIKSISLEEVRDFLLEDAIKSFPKTVREEMSDELYGYICNIHLMSSITSDNDQ